MSYRWKRRSLHAIKVKVCEFKNLIDIPAELLKPVNHFGTKTWEQREESRFRPYTFTKNAINNSTCMIFQIFYTVSLHQSTCHPWWEYNSSVFDPFQPPTSTSEGHPSIMHDESSKQLFLVTKMCRCCWPVARIYCTTLPIIGNFPWHDLESCSFKYWGRNILQQLLVINCLRMILLLLRLNLCQTGINCISGVMVSVLSSCVLDILGSSPS